MMQDWKVVKTQLDLIAKTYAQVHMHVQKAVARGECAEPNMPTIVFGDAVREGHSINSHVQMGRNALFVQIALDTEPDEMAHLMVFAILRSLAQHAGLKAAPPSENERLLSWQSRFSLGVHNIEKEMAKR